MITRVVLLKTTGITSGPTIESDFKEMKALGANVVRVHLQVALNS